MSYSAQSLDEVKDALNIYSTVDDDSEYIHYSLYYRMMIQSTFTIHYITVFYSTICITVFCVFCNTVCIIWL